MGIKGDKGRDEGTLMAELLLEKFAIIPGITKKKMFGGHGIFCNGKMFGMVDSKAHPYLKFNESNKALFEKYGAKFHSKMPYSSIPPEVMKDLDKLLEWAQTSIAIQK
ncbi:MAG: DNA transformation protein [Arcticibacterium sp.]|jgi:DNA transformation protein